MSPLASDDTAVDHLDGAQDSIDANVLTQPNLLESSNAYRRHNDCHIPTIIWQEPRNGSNHWPAEVNALPHLPSDQPLTLSSKRMQH
jgi:hypothetical protein